MENNLRLVIGTCLAASACTIFSPDAQSVLRSAQKAMGSVKSIQYSGAGMNAFYGQALTAGQEWPRRDLTSYTRIINYDQKSGSEDLMFAKPVFGGQHQNMHVSGDKAWTVGPNGPVPQMAQAEARQLQILLTPHGFLKGALDSGNATLKTDGSKVVTFTALGKYQVAGTIDSQNMVTKVETTVADPVLGDLPMVATYSDYKDFSGVKFPTRILQTQGGFPVWDLTINHVQPDAPADLPVPEAVRSAVISPFKVDSVKLADGVWFLSGTGHHSLVVEFKDYIAVIEASVNDAGSMAVMGEARKLVPNKPIKYVLNTHHHFDHSGGLRAFVAEGATIVTHQSNVPYFEKAFRAPAPLFPDALAKNPKPPVLQGVTDKFVLTDGKQTIEAYATPGDDHSDELLIFYLLPSRILVEADSYGPGPPDAPPPSPVPPNALALYENIQRLKLNVATIAPIHGRAAVPMAQFLKFIGKRS